MTSIQFVDFATARDARGVRMVVSGLLPSPWSEGAKGVFHLAGVPALAVRFARDEPEMLAWMGAQNVPVVIHDDALPRTGWAEIVSLAERLAGPGALVPIDVEARVRCFGLLNELAGEDGLGWCSRLLMIEAGLETRGARGFPLPVAQMLAPRYRQPPSHPGGPRARIREVLERLDGELGRAREAAHAYFFGDRPGALDVYLATFLTPLSGCSEADCPKALPRLREAFASLSAELGAEVPARLLEHRRQMFDAHLPWPIAL